MSLNEYEAMFESQCGVCRVCGTKFKNNLLTPVVDHDHGTGKVRGLLCSNCNVMVGQAKNDPEILESAAWYLRYGTSTA